ncbi:MtnX-like HAD-IB family phosphatase [Agrobacterium sp. rho-13.3]|uniref:MtnX-like HAD-IB family phosphatase n=1 Tax=Agrobacterium sp. rho-13.3 TaxID=3072980 RepID=UPI002A1794D8|nr:MtnX-like HAD-IB family phosphatase [Agrobacterium sp. rho-13.3]MDX8308107.1 MtnX-like HAD-IB family phosphatase [Agrobacterium sp. rho-13.3]
MHAFCDFDGTIAVDDVTDLVLERFATDKWHRLEDDWIAGKITAAECMRAQIPLIDATLQDLNGFLDTIEIDPGFPAFFDFCRKNGVGLTVVSDGVDHFIRRILAKYGMTNIAVTANRMSSSISQQRFQYRLDTPFASAGCPAGSGVCKCNIIQAQGDHIYVGDGRSDFCVSHQALLVFAKSKLATYCDQQAIPFIPYEGFVDVQSALASLLDKTSSRVPASRLARTA